MKYFVKTEFLKIHWNCGKFADITTEKERKENTERSQKDAAWFGMNLFLFCFDSEDWDSFEVCIKLTGQFYQYILTSFVVPEKWEIVYFSKWDIFLKLWIEEFRGYNALIKDDILSWKDNERIDLFDNVSFFMCVLKEFLSTCLRIDFFFLIESTQVGHYFVIIAIKWC